MKNGVLGLKQSIFLFYILMLFNDILGYIYFKAALFERIVHTQHKYPDNDKNIFVCCHFFKQEKKKLY